MSHCYVVVMIIAIGIDWYCCRVVIVNWCCQLTIFVAAMLYLVSVATVHFTTVFVAMSVITVFLVFHCHWLILLLLSIVIAGFSWSLLSG